MTIRPGDRVYVYSNVRPGTKVLGKVIEIAPNPISRCPLYIETPEGRSYYPKDEVELVTHSHPLEE